MSRLESRCKRNEYSDREIFDKFIDDVLASIVSGKLVLWLGAGISHPPPSNMPLASEIRSYVIRKLLARQPIREFLSLERQILENASQLPFERFVQVVDINASVLKTIRDVFRGGRPNRNHIFVAKLIACGALKIVLTTNFDLLLEKALRHCNLDRDTHYNVYFPKRHFSGFDVQNLQLPVILKVHGSADSAKSLRVTLDVIANSTGSVALSRILRQIVGNEDFHVIVLGYSGSDRFDINPILNTVLRGGRVSWIKHEPNEMSITKLEYPFHRMKGEVVSCNTNRIIEELWKRLFKLKTDLPSSTQMLWKRKFDDWAKRLTRQKAMFTLGRMMKVAEDFSLAGEFFARLLLLSREQSDRWYSAMSLNELGLLELRVGHAQHAQDYFNKSIDALRELGKGVMTVRNNLALAYQQKGDVDKAARLYSQSLRILRRRMDKNTLAITLQLLATLYHENDRIREAVGLYDESLRVSLRIGNPYGVAVATYQLAAINEKRKKFNEGLDLHTKSLEVFWELGSCQGMRLSLLGIGRTLLELGNDYVTNGKKDEAMVYYKLSAILNNELAVVDIHDVPLLTSKYLEAQGAVLGVRDNEGKTRLNLDNKEPRVLKQKPIHDLWFRCPPRCWRCEESARIEIGRSVDI